MTSTQLCMICEDWRHSDLQFPVVQFSKPSMVASYSQSSLRGAKRRQLACPPLTSDVPIPFPRPDWELSSRSSPRTPGRVTTRRKESWIHRVAALKALVTVSRQLNNGVFRTLSSQLELLKRICKAHSGTMRMVTGQRSVAGNAEWIFELKDPRGSATVLPCAQVMWLDSSDFWKICVFSTKSPAEFRPDG